MPHGLEVADRGAFAALRAAGGVIPHPVAGRCVHAQPRIQTARHGRGFQAHTTVGTAVADHTSAAAGGHFEKGLGNVALPTVVPDNGQGLLLADPPGMVFPTVIQPEIGYLLPDGKAARSGFT